MGRLRPIGDLGYKIIYIKMSFKLLKSGHYFSENWLLSKKGLHIYTKPLDAGPLEVGPWARAH